MTIRLQPVIEPWQVCESVGSAVHGSINTNGDVVYSLVPEACDHFLHAIDALHRRLDIGRSLLGRRLLDSHLELERDKDRPRTHTQHSQ